MSLNVIIVDDEARAHKVIESYIERTDDIHLTGNFFDAISAREFIMHNPVHLIFLDITMPEVSGFDLIRLLDNPPLIIITTAHADFALESYDYNVIDYLKKPIPFERFSKAVSKARTLLSSGKQGSLLPDNIQVKIDGKDRIIPFTDIHYFQSLGNYIKIITNDKPLIVQSTTGEIEANLPKELFIRIHKSFIVNRSKISSVSKDGITIGSLLLPIGKTFKKYVSEAFH